MAIKVELVQNMIDAACRKVTENEDAWRGFLKCSAYMYKYDFGNQLAIYAQQPEAVACAGYSTWIKLGRYVKRGSKGIRLVNRSNYADKDYVFDVADTARLDGTEKFAVWQASHDTVNMYLVDEGISEDDTFVGLIKSVERESTESFATYASALLERTPQDSQNIQKVMEKINRLAILASMSSSYVVLHRCGVDVDSMEFDFSALPELDEMKDFRAFGETLYATQKIVLKKLEQATKKALANNRNILYDKNKGRTNVRRVIDRREDNGTDIQMGRRLSGTESGTAEAADERSGLLGADERSLSGGAQAFYLVGDEYRGNTETAPVGYRPDGGGDERNDDTSSDEKIRGHRRTESRESNGMGAQGQSDPTNHSGTNPKRSDLQLEASEEQLSFSLFPSETEQRETLIKEKQQGGDEKIVPSFSVSQNVIDLALASSPPESLRLSLCADFEKGLPVERLALRMARQWSGGRGFTIGGENYAIWADTEGVKIAGGKEARFSLSAKTLTWEETAGRVIELLESGSYLDKEAYSKVSGHDLKTAAAELLYMCQDMSDTARHENFMPHLRQAYEKHGYSDSIAAIQVLLTESEDLQALTDEVRIFADACESNPELMRFRFHAPKKSLRVLEDAARERQIYQPQEHRTLHADSMYISDDEIDAALLSGGNVSGNRKRTEDYFNQEHTPKEKAEFLKAVFGTGGHSGPEMIDEWHDAAGLRLRRADCKEVHLTWQQAAKRMEVLLTKLPKEEQLEDIDLAENPLTQEVTAEPLEDVSKQLYKAFASLVPDIINENAQSITLSAGRYDLDLVIERLTDTHISMTHYVQSSGDLLADPDMEFVINLKQQTLTPISYTNDVQSRRIEVALDDKEFNLEALSNLCEYALMWLTNLREKRYTVKQEALGQENDQTEIYQLLDRLKSDCEYYLSSGNRHAKHLWTGSETTQIAKMEELYHQLREKPVWLSLEDIREYEKQMMPGILPGTKQTSASETQNAPLGEENMMNRPSSSSDEKTLETTHFALMDESLGIGTVSEKYQANIAAITTLKTLQGENRAATSEEKEILSHYTGWGGLAKSFEEGSAQSEELKGLLTEVEYQSARDSVLNAHYTPPIVMDAMYRTLAHIGFEGGNILEPACGVGNFFGRMSQDMRIKSNLYGVELDELSAQIARFIYPEVKIEIKGFEDTHFQDNAFDLAVGNVPFGDYSISDAYGKGFHIHDYFFAAALDKVRPGGVVAFITSSGTLDKKASHIREHLACRADLLGAIRLPDMTFKANAGTETTTDIIFLQKREEPRKDLTDLDWIDLAEDEQGLTYNRYFIQHPEMVVGEMREVSGPYGMRTVCKLDDTDTFRDKLFAATGRIQGSMQMVQLIELPEIEENGADVNEFLAADIPAYSYGLDASGRVVYHEGDRIFTVTCKPAEGERIKGMIQIRKAVRRLIDAQVGDANEEIIIDLRLALNRIYDRYTDKYGLIHSRENKRAFERDASYPLLSSLEIVDEDGKLIRKADIFMKRTIRKAVPVTSVETLQEALAVSLAEKGGVDIPYMAKLAGCSKDAVIAGLKGQIYEVPDENRYVPADEYLSGNIREKMQAAKQYTGFEENVKALKSVLPEPLGPGEIAVRLGSTWIPVDIYKDFIYELLQTPFYMRNLRQIDLTYSPSLDVWNIKGKSLGGNVLVNTTYGTERANAYRIIESTMNLRPMQITDVVTDEDGKERRVVNAKETALACEKQDLIKEKFQNWIWEDSERRERLCEIYNDRFNSIRPREYDGSHLSFPGMNPEVELREHQKRAVARQVYGGNTLLAHVVGAGKTFEIAAAVMERKRLGISSKAMIVVPNHLIGQWASEFLTLYPAANILAVTKRDFEKSRRKAFCARIATSDVDAVIIAHSQFEMIPLSKERQVKFLREQINQIRYEIQVSAAENDRNFTVKQLVSMEKKLSKRLKDALGASRRDDVLDFEQLGIDFLCVDEAHSYKNLALSTKMRNVAGVSTGGANKSFDMYAKCRYMDEVTGGKGITFATGTPVSNSIAELYTMQRYLQYDLLQRLDMVTFDRWASTFAESTTSYELSPEGSSYRQKTRFASFFNLPELMAGFKECADIQTADMLQLDTPEPEYINIVLNPSERQKAMLKEIGERADKIRLGNVDAREDNMLKVTTDGRKLALDERLLPFDDSKIEQLGLELHQSKVEACGEKIVEIYRQTTAQSSAQLVFCDQSTPKGDGSFNVYDDLKTKLITSGISEKEIAFIHDAKTDAQKNDLFSKVRKGCVRVLIGSTSKMGAGMNVQNKLVALHHLDVPWKPADIQQQEGRILRQGNENSEVKIYRYITENTFDAYSWQLIENKLKFIGQIMTSKAPVRSCEDIDDAVFSAAEAKAQATGDPRIKERIELENDVSRLRLSLGNYNNERYQMQGQLERILPKKIADLSERIEKVAADAAYFTAHEIPDGDDFLMKVEGKIYAVRAEAGVALLQAARNGDKEQFTVAGEYAGFILSVRAMDYSDEVDVRIERESSMVIEGGESPVGVVIRIKNAIQKLPEKLSKLKEEKSAAEADMRRIKTQISKPFERADELAEKEKRLKELTNLLEEKSGGIAKSNKKQNLRNTLRQ
ncbi:LPD11 domain-containing protein [Ihubacter sp. mB4P-1]|uniref:LPD11 domain-containing protein n=1 Tax=Ihubacter sp. mB4P-1 TaxID=3242370 RepID=UPI003C7E4380